MNKTELRIPKLGESVREVQLNRFLKAVGDYIEKDEIIAEVTTDKVDAEVPSTCSGQILELLFKEGDEIEVGAVYALVDETAKPSKEKGSQHNREGEQSVETSKVDEQSLKGFGEATSEKGNEVGFLSPLVRKMMQAEGVTQAELAQIHGTGHNGRISKNDLLAYISRRQQGHTTPATSTNPEKSQATMQSTSGTRTGKLPTPSAVIQSHSGAADLIEMDKMRKIIAQRMKQSVQISPHVTAYVEADVTDLVQWREKHKEAFFSKFGQKLTITPLLVMAVVRAIQDFPMINVSVDETETKIIRHHDINIGIATELPDGNLIVPVIKGATQYNLEGMAKQLNQLVNKARTNKLSPDDVRGGTFTISNVGTFGNVMGTPIINQPEVAILATGVIKKKPAILETPAGDVFAARQFMFLSLSFDHRVVDGSLGGVFLKRIADYLEQWDVNTSL